MTDKSVTIGLFETADLFLIAGMGWKFEACRSAFSQNPPFQGTGKPMLSQAMEDRNIGDKMTGKVFGT